MKTKLLYGALLTTLLSLSALTGCGKKSGEDKYDKKGRLILEISNVYFGGSSEEGIRPYDGADTYTEIINDKFGVKITPSSPSYGTWEDDVNIAVSGRSMTDVIHYNVKAYNFGVYEQWVKKMNIKALPTDLSPWPNLQSMLNNISNIDALKIDGKLYGIPIANDISNPEKDFSNMTYVYRRDWAKAIDEANKNNAGYTPIYKEGDVYTWDEFQSLLKAFKTYVDNNNIKEDAVLVDQPWAFPSVTNFYKKAPHCFAKDSSGRAINNFTSDEYIQGLDVAKEYINKGYYLGEQFLYTEENDRAYTKYKSGLAGIFYDNFSFTNYTKLRRALAKNPDVSNPDDAVAFLKVKGPNDDKFALESTENWFSMTLFNYDISETKMNKVLDIINYLLSDEGTRLAVYGQEGYDYYMQDGKVVLSDQGWEKDPTDLSGKTYIYKSNGAKSLRYMATLGNDYKSYDPYTEADLDSYNAVTAWQNEMKAAKEAGQLRVVQEPVDLSWMSTPSKNEYTDGMLKNSKAKGTQYCYNQPITTREAYIAAVEAVEGWTATLKEMNEKLGK